jgi:hypothetical protein
MYKYNKLIAWQHWLVGDPKDVAEKILRHSEALGGVSRLTFQMDVAATSNPKILQAIELIGGKVKMLVNY